MSKFGRESSCEDWTVPDDSYIANIKIGYNANEVTYMKASTNKFVSFERGRVGSLDKTYVVNFSEYEPFVGFVGYETTVLEAIGFYKFKCVADLP